MMCLDTNINFFELLNFFVWSLSPSLTISWMKKIRCIYGVKTFEMDENLKKMKRNPQKNQKFKKRK